MLRHFVGIDLGLRQCRTRAPSSGSVTCRRNTNWKAVRVFAVSAVILSAEAIKRSRNARRCHFEDRAAAVAVGAVGTGPATLRDIYLAANDFYELLQKWHDAFENEWAFSPQSEQFVLRLNRARFRRGFCATDALPIVQE